jgi:hypothetical protein
MDAGRRHPDLLTPEEAAEYLRLTSAKALEKLRNEKMLTGHDGWAPYMIYHREDLDRCALRMCGKDPDAGKPNKVGFKPRLAGGQR